MGNILNILKWDAQRNLHLLRKPVDKDKWATEPAVVNAFYNPNKNDIGEWTKHFEVFSTQRSSHSQFFRLESCNHYSIAQTSPNPSTMVALV
jgi:predicted metalloendopeptidase